MATTAMRAPLARPDDRFFLISAILMTVVLVFGFSASIVLGHSSFHSPWFVHLHGLIFFGWTMLYLLQTALATTGSVALHRRLGWLALIWIPAMVVMGMTVTVLSIRADRTPFFFTPAYFLILDPLTVLTFAGFAIAAIVMRRRTDWHRRLMFCAMTELTGPGFGRFLPLPLVIPYAGWLVFAAIMLFPLAGILFDRSRFGRVHPAWIWGVGIMAAMHITMTAMAASPIGPALFRLVTAGSPVALVDPSAYPPPPWAVRPK